VIENHELHNIFPTPFFFFTLSKDCIKKLGDEVTAEYKKNCDDPSTHSKADHLVSDLDGLVGFCKNKGINVYQSSSDLQTREEFSFINEVIFDACRLWEENTKCKVETFDINLMWANIYRPNGFNAEHFHPNSFLSGIILIKDPQTWTKDGVRHNQAGGTIFYSPINQNFVIMPDTAEEGSSHYTPTIKPDWKEGTMVLFPSWLRHAANPYVPHPDDKNEHRVTLSFNIMVRGSMGKVSQLTHHVY
tara:strand:+ start:3056 stop:3793 length:738 start_codon:yes stop_codon:yes gene_type:complete